MSKATIVGLALAALLTALPWTNVRGDAIESALRATVRITQGATSGTGFFVADDVPPAPSQTWLVTAAHALKEVPGTHCVVVLRTENADGTWQRRETRLTVRDHDRPLWTKHPEADVAVIAMDLPEGTGIRPLPFSRVADDGWLADRKIRVGREVFVPCFPVALEANPAGWPILRRGSLASHPLYPTPKSLFVDYSNFGGDSGAPAVALVDDEPLVVGLIIATQRQTDRVILPFEERTTHMPLGLAIAVPSPFVRQTIEAARKSRREP